jgi:hypothetical protein
MLMLNEVEPLWMDWMAANSYSGKLRDPPLHVTVMDQPPATTLGTIWEQRPQIQMKETFIHVHYYQMTPFP